jgi:hypothetical protein
MVAGGSRAGDTVVMRMQPRIALLKSRAAQAAGPPIFDFGFSIFD